MEQRLLKVRQAAAYLGITPGEVYDKLTLKEIPYIPTGTRGKRIDKKDLDAYIERSKVK